MAVTMEAEQWFVGYEVELTTVAGEVVEGTVFAYDKVLQCVLITSPGSQPGSSNLKLLKLSNIKQIDKSSTPSGDFDRSLPPIDIKRLEAREAKALQRAEDSVASIGEGVTEAAQNIFDAIHKTMPCKWVGTSIEVMQEVMITEPYADSNCSLKEADGNPNVLDRVRHILGQITS